jgi:insertion element IS1 protein InsB
LERISLRGIGRVPQVSWASLPDIYQKCILAYTDFWQAYQTVIPRKSHRAVGKESGQTNHIERLNNTFRQRLSRLVSPQR